MIRETGLGNYYRTDDVGEECRARRGPRLSVTQIETEILARLFDGKTVIEIGTGIGVSTRAIASTALHVYTFDPDPWVAEHVAPSLPENVTFKPAHSDETADACFIDGDHSYTAVLRDIAIARDFTKQDPLVIHDINIPGVYNAMRESNIHLIEDFGRPCYMALVSIGPPK